MQNNSNKLNRVN